jgi:Spy/CpxP family protein refolding chaperone
MESKTHSRAKARMMVITIFVIGFIAGALSLNLYQRLTAGSDKHEPPRGQAYVLDKMNRKLNLTSDQQQQIGEILGQTSEKYRELKKELDPLFKNVEPRFDAIRQESRNRIRATLTAEQLPKFEDMVKEQDKLRAEEKEGKK